MFRLTYRSYNSCTHLTICALRQARVARTISIRTENKTRFCVLSPTETSTNDLASIFALKRKSGDCICLHGAVGAGKSAFSRAYIRAIEDDDGLPVPSPTYLLQNIYDFDDGPEVHHFDLYRLAGPQDLERLDMQTSFRTAVSLIEWPDRLQHTVPEQRLDVHIRPLTAEEEGLANAEREDAEKGSQSEDYTDDRCRLVCLEPHGQHWQEVVASFQEQLGQTGLKPVPAALADMMHAAEEAE